MSCLSRIRLVDRDNPNQTVSLHETHSDGHNVLLYPMKNKEK